MNRYFKYGVAVLAGVMILMMALVMVVSFAINPNDYKPQIIQLVKEKKERTLTLDGDIKLAFFPKLGLDLGHSSVSDFRGKKEFAAVEGMRLYVSWWPLLSKKLVIDQIRIEGVHANLVRFKDGTTNFDDLLKKEEEDKRVKFDIDSVRIDGSTLSFRDEMEERQLSLSDIKIRTGRLANGEPTNLSADFMLQCDHPQAKAQIHAATGLIFDTVAKRLAAKGLNLEIQGDAAGLSRLAVGLKGDVTLDRVADRLLVENLGAAVAGTRSKDEFDIRLIAPRMEWATGNMATEKIEIVAKTQASEGNGDEMGLVASIPSIEGNSQSFRAGMLNVDVNARQAGVEYKGKFSTPLSGNLKEKEFALPDLKGSLAARIANMPEGGLKLDASGTAQFSLEHQSARVNLISRLDDSHIELNAGINPAVTPHFTIDLAIDQIDVDRYLSDRSPQGKPQRKSQIDFEKLRSIDASGSVRIGSLKLNNIKVRNVRLEFKTNGGRLEIGPRNADSSPGTGSKAMNGKENLDLEAIKGLFH